MLHSLATTKILPVRVLHPTGDHRFIALVKGVFEELGIAGVDGYVELLPIDVLCQQVERMLGLSISLR